MILFDETENKYYQLLAYMLKSKNAYDRGDISRLLEENLPGEADFEVTEALFAADEGEELIYMVSEGKLVPVLPEDFPIRNSNIENQAARSLVSNPYCPFYISHAPITVTVTFRNHPRTFRKQKSLHPKVQA